MKAVTSPLDSHGLGMRNSCVSNTFRPNHRRFPDSLLAGSFGGRGP
jgi:hypothetical protein